MAYSTTPLCFGVVFVLSAIYSFIRIESKSIFHVIVLIFAVAFGSFSVHGLLGFVHHYLNLAVLSSYPSPDKFGSSLDAALGGPAEPGESHAFMIEKPAFALQATAISG